MSEPTLKVYLVHYNLLRLNWGGRTKFVRQFQGLNDPLFTKLGAKELHAIPKAQLLSPLETYHILRAWGLISTEDVLGYFRDR